MAKELGMIHTVNQSVAVTSPATPSVFGSIDVPGELTKQLNRMIHQGNFFKVVGIDIGIDTQGTTGGGQVSGKIRYYAPTRGRCQAYRSAFKAMATVMKNQGINMRDNHLYDFRVPLSNQSNLGGNPYSNQATLDGANGLVMCSVDAAGAPEDPPTTRAGQDVTFIHNRSVQPEYEGTVGDLFNPGFDTLQQTYAAGTDFVLNDTIPYTGNHDSADRQYEFIPFNMSWTPDSTDIATTFNWKPDPALYLAVMLGQFDIFIEELNVDEGAPGINLRFAVHVSGWKSIMGNPDTKKRRSRRSKKGRK